MQERHSRASHKRRFVRPASDNDPHKKLHWFATLAASGSGARKARYLRPEKSPSQLTIVLLDTSASTLGCNGLADAKGALLQLATETYLKRESLCLMTFGNERIETLLHPQRAPKNIEPVLNNIHAGGGTPLRKALLQVRDFVARQSAHYERCKLYVFTDGRSTESLHNIHLDCDVMVVDTEAAAVKLGMGKILAQHLHGDYIHLQSLST